MSDASNRVEPSEPMLYLEIVKGATRFPNRPVYEGVFLIGSGPNCDLRLGGSETPAVHSIVRAAADDVHIESLTRRPSLRVNGSPCERAGLRDGDRIQIGSIQMIARFRLVPSAPVMMQPNPDQVSELTAEQLIDLLEEDLALVEEHDSTAAAGAEMLLDAAMKAAIERPDEIHSEVHVIDPDDDLQDSHAEAAQLVVALNRIADDLNSRVDHLRRKEEVYSEAAEELLAMQNRFSGLLERVLERLDSGSEERRRSA